MSLPVNGRLAASDDTGLAIEVAEAYGNCPPYITPRAVAGRQDPTRSTERPALDNEGVLNFEAARIVASADTFFLGTQHPERGADATHKGGDPGFTRVEDHGIVWPDYAGNNMFNSLGNLTADPVAALLFVDFDSGEVPQLSGTAEVEWSGRTRAVRFRPERGVLHGSALRGRG